MSDYDDGCIAVCISACFVTVSLWISVACTQYVLMVLFGKDIPLIGDIVIAIVAGAIAVPLAVVLYVLRYFGVM